MEVKNKNVCAGFSKYKKGSMTVEATLLMTVLIPLLTALIYLGFYLHDWAWIQNFARETAVHMIMGQNVEQNEVQKGILWINNINTNVSVEKEEITVKQTGSFFVPGLVTRFLTDNRLPLNYTVTKPIIDAKKKIQNWRNLEKLAGGR